jgi:ribosomal protein S18 acetylase RimI-like enzyme
MPMITTAPATEYDESFLYELYASTRQEEMAFSGWEAAQIETFLRMQFRLRTASYAAQYPSAEHNIIASEGQPVGATIVNRSDTEISLVDIAFLPMHRNKGFGTLLLNSLKDESLASDRPIRLQVDRQGIALHLYERLGFAATGEDALRIAMVWIPKAGTTIAGATP